MERAIGRGYLCRGQERGNEREPFVRFGNDLGPSPPSNDRSVAGSSETVRPCAPGPHRLHIPPRLAEEGRGRDAWQQALGGRLKTNPINVSANISDTAIVLSERRVASLRDIAFARHRFTHGAPAPLSLPSFDEDTRRAPGNLVLR